MHFDFLNKLKNKIRNLDLYYLNFALKHQVKAMLFGRKEFCRSYDNNDNLFWLRRQLHALEKALTMRDFAKEEFGKSYVQKLVITYIRLKQKGRDESTLQWAEQVFYAYFEKVTSRELDKFKEMFLNNTAQIKINNYYKSRKEYNQSKIGFNELLTLAKQRRSIRWFIDKKVEIEKIYEAIELALLSPSSCNQQSFRLRLIENEKLMKEILDIPGGMSGYTHQIPLIILVTGLYRAYPNYADRNLPIIDASFFAMVFEFALETLGLSSTTINWSQTNKTDKEVRRKIALDLDEFVIFCIAVGYADENALVATSGKRSIQDMVIKEVHK